MEGINEAPPVDPGEDDGGRIRRYVAALRSGEWTQAVGLLSYRGTYCCLGVACEVAIEDGMPLMRERYMGEVSAYGMPGSRTHRSTPPMELRQWYGFWGENNHETRASVPKVKIHHSTLARFLSVADQMRAEAMDREWSPDAWFKATTLNDYYGFTFDLIADCFEYTYLPQDWAARAES